MRPFAAFAGILVLATTVAAQTEQLASLPACAASCIISNIKATRCALTDIQCICNDQSFAATISACTMQKCTPREGLTKRISAEQCGIKPRNRGPQFIAIYTSCFVITWVFYLTRMVARIVFKVGDLGMDDLMITFSLAFSVLGLVSTSQMTRYGLGQDIWNIDFDKFNDLLFWHWMAEMVYLWITSFLKLSLLFFLIRIFRTTHLNKWIWIAVAFQSAFTVAFALVTIFQCTPVAYVWQSWSGEYTGKCINVNAASWSMAAIGIAFEIVVLSLPIRELWKLNLSLSKKLYTIAMFSLGFVVTLISILRLQSLITFSKTYNLTYDNFPIVYWSAFESTFSTVALCLPTLKPFAGTIALRYFNTGSRTTTNTSSSLTSRTSLFSRFGKRRFNTPVNSNTCSLAQDGVICEAEPKNQQINTSEGPPFADESSYSYQVKPELWLSEIDHAHETTPRSAHSGRIQLTQSK